MPALKNPKHERFAQELAKGKSAVEAHKLAGYSENRGNAATLKQNKAILKRVEELLNRRNEIDIKATQKAVEKLAITKEAVLAELVKIGFYDVRKAVKWGDAIAVEDKDGNHVITNGIALVPSDQMDPDTAAAISSVETTPSGAVRIKFYDKKSALVDIGKHLGMFVERREIGGPGDFDSMTEDELRRQIEEDEAALAALGLYDAEAGSDSIN